MGQNLLSSFISQLFLVNNLECIPPIDGKVPEDAFVWHWGGINTFIQNLLILFAAFLFRFTRRSGEHAL